MTPNKKKGFNKGHANLIPIKKGEVRNPKGRPKRELCIPDILRTIGVEKVIVRIDQVIKGVVVSNNIEMTRQQAILRKVYSEASRGQGWAIMFIAERTEGRVKYDIDLNAKVKQTQIVEYKRHIKELSDKTYDELVAEINQSINTDK